MSVQTRVITEDEADIRLDRWFRRHFPSLTQGGIQKMCRTGQIRVEGKRAETSTRLVPGQLIRIPPLPKGEEEGAVERRVHVVDPLLEAEMLKMVLYRDDHVLVLNKPHGLPTQGGDGIRRHLDGMLDGLRLGSEHRPRLVHRLDRDTSGVLVVARSPGVAAKMAASFRGRDVDKTYWAVVCGRPVPVVGRIDVNLVKIEGFRGERAAVAGQYDKEFARAITDYRTLDHAARKLAWLELKPLTGRTHQLRVSCGSIGAPILGDLPYGREVEGRNTALVDGLGEKLHLHARAIAFPHPAGGLLRVEAPLPEHIADTFKTLGFDNPDPAGALRSR
jgi:23S rRNA pseudouridine955/2504/2580 synthase